MIRLKLPTSTNAAATFRKWAAELRSKVFIEVLDFLLEEWEPEYGASTGDTFNLVTTASAWGIKIGNWFLFLIEASGTTGGGPTYISFTIPYTMTNGACTGSVVDAGAEIGGFGGAVTNSNQFQVRKGDGTAWANGAGRFMRLFGFAKIDDSEI